MVQPGGFKPHIREAHQPNAERRIIRVSGDETAHCPDYRYAKEKHNERGTKRQKRELGDFGPALGTKFCCVNARFNGVSFSLQFLQGGHRFRYRFPRESCTEVSNRGICTRNTRAFEPTKLIINRAQVGLRFCPTESAERPQALERKCWPIRTEDHRRYGEP